LGPAQLLRNQLRHQLSFKQPKQPAPAGTDSERNVPGDDFGSYETRTIFTKPVPRNVSLDGYARTLFDANTPPEECVSPGLMTCLARRFNISEAQAANAIIDANHDLNSAVEVILRRTTTSIERPFGLVAVEYYEPEVYCITSFAVPRHEQLRDPDVLDAVHELTLSAAEMPSDASPTELLRRFKTDWATEQGDKCSEVMRRVPHGGLDVTSICLLPLGEYSANGHFVRHPSSADHPNIGTAACVACLDLTTGINNRFRFEVERIADSVSEHVVQEHLCFGQQVHLLKQPYFWDPEYSVEDYLRYKESLLQPAAILNQLRYAFSSHHIDDQPAFALDPGTGPVHKSKRNVARPNPYRNLIELEELKTKQHALGKHYKENATPSHCFTRSGMPVLIASAAGENSGFAGNLKNETFGDIAHMEAQVFGTAGQTSAVEKLWKRYYTDNLF
jgi:hypothetical protein